MTAEIAIANGSGVALAADSAVTIGGKKIYNSAIKLFSLSKYEPVGIMIYGNASLLDVPWETIIKECRRSLGDTRFTHLHNYGDYFLDFIRKNNQFFSEQSQKNWLLGNAHSYYSLIKEELEEKVKDHFRHNGSVSAQQSKQYFHQVINRHFDNLKALDYCTDFDKDSDNELKSHFKPELKEIIDTTFQNLKITSPYLSKLYDIAIYIHTRTLFPSGTSGIVIAGFGNDEIFPSIITYEIEGYIHDRLKFKVDEERCSTVSNGNSCTIIPFAQSDMVNSFMDGVNPDLINVINEYTSLTFDKLPELLTDELLGDDHAKNHSIRNHLRNSSEKLHNGLKQIINEVINNLHTNPVMKMVSALPKDELAAMAESLVNLTAFKRKMTESLETVGGPIDVLVISKGDGLVWVKRKHYFPRELNDTFFSNYFKG